MFFLPELVQLLIVTRLHSGFTGGPLSGAHLTVLISVLEGLDETEGFIDVAADRQVTDGVVAEDTVAIDDVSGAESDTTVTISRVLDVAAVVLANLL